MAFLGRIARNSNFLKSAYQNKCLAIPLNSNFKRQYGATYEGDGKTKVSILNKNIQNLVMVNSFSQYGFRLNNDMTVIGPMAIFPRTVMSWNVNTFEDINEDSLTAFYILEPKLDILIIGIGDMVPSKLLLKDVTDFMKKHRINVEILRTEQACATFNFLNAENRTVAAALIPPLHLSYNENDLVQTKLKRKELFADNL